MFVSQILWVLHCFYNPFALRIAHTKAPKSKQAKNPRSLLCTNGLRNDLPLKMCVLCSLLKTRLETFNAKTMGLTYHPLKSEAEK